MLYQYTQKDVRIHLEKLEQLASRSAMYIQYVSVLIRNNQIITWANNSKGYPAAVALLKKVQKVDSNDILIIYRKGKDRMNDHSAPCIQSLKAMREKNVRICAYWGKLNHGINPFIVTQVSKINTDYKTYSQRLEQFSCKKCILSFQTAQQVADHARQVHNGKNAIYRDKNYGVKWEVGKNLKPKQL